MTVEAYAMKILTDHGCDCYTYGNCPSENVLEDLKEAYPDGMEFPYIEVANAILRVSRPKPLYRDPWKMLWDNDSACDGIGYESLGAAQASAEDTLIDWMCQARAEWKDLFDPTEEELVDYNYMICNFSAYVAKYNQDTDKYEEYWWPDEDEIGWKELTMEDIAAEREAYENA